MPLIGKYASLLAMKLVRIGGSCLLVAAVLASAAVAPARPAAAGCRPAAGKRIALTPHYRFTLLIGNVENMYMPRQVRANHLKHGEEMLRGTMTTGAAMMGGPVRHLEVQICARATRAVVTKANPRIVVDDRTKGKTLVLPVSVMEGIGEGVADLHYGNNIAMPRKHRFLVAVSWKGERVRFAFVSQ